MLLYNAKILTMTSENPTLLHGAVGVVGNRIALVSDSPSEIAQFEAEHPTLRKIDCQGRVLMPGLINTHTHVAMTLQRSSGDDIELMAWLNETVWPFEALQTDDDIEAGARLGIAEMLLGGTTTFVDMYWSEHAIANAAEDLGIRALLGESTLDGERMEIFEQNILRLVERTKSCDRLSTVIAPHAPYTCCPDTMKRCAELSEQLSLPINTHLAETRSEVETIKEVYNQTPTEYLDSCGVLTPSTILAHSIYLNDKDIEIVKSRGAHIAHNPQCNMKISSGVAPIVKMHAEGINCTIGTDGVCSNNDLDMWDEMRTASFLHKLSSGDPTSLKAYEVLKMATTNAAKAIGHQGELGVIAQGALADMIVVNTSKPHYRPHNDIISSLVYCGKAADVQWVVVNGELLVDNYELTTCDVESLCQDVESRCQRIFKALGRSDS